MSDLTARAIADLKAELAESKAAANRVTESMGSEIMRLQGELEQQRTRAEAAEAELSAVTHHRNDLLAFNKRDRQIMAATGVKETLLRDAIPALAQQRDEARAKLASAEQELRAVSEAFNRHMEEGRSKPEVRVAEANALSALFDDVAARNKLAAIRAHLAGVDVDVSEYAVKQHAAVGLDYTPIFNATLARFFAAAREALEP